MTPMASAEDVFDHESQNDPIVFTDEEGVSWLVKSGTGTEEAEVAVYEIAASLFGGVVPETKAVSFKGSPASAQMVVEGETAHDLGTPALLRATRIPSVMKDLANIVVMDYMLGNPDRHGHNWIVSEDRAYAIDNGKAFDSGVLFKNALRVAYRCLLTDDCSATPLFIAQIVNVLSRLPSDDPTGMIPDWNKRLREGVSVVGVWRAELETLCQTAR